MVSLSHVMCYILLINRLYDPECFIYVAGSTNALLVSGSRTINFCLLFVYRYRSLVTFYCSAACCVLRLAVYPSALAYKKPWLVGHFTDRDRRPELPLGVGLQAGHSNSLIYPKVFCSCMIVLGCIV